MIDPGHPLQQFGDLALFPLQLLFVGQILILAAPTLGKQRALGFHPVRAWRNDFQKVGLRVVGRIAEYTGSDRFSG